MCVCVCVASDSVLVCTWYSTGRPYQEDLYAFDFWSYSGSGADALTSSPLSSNKTVLSALLISLSLCCFLYLCLSSRLCQSLISPLLSLFFTLCLYSIINSSIHPCFLLLTVNISPSVLLFSLPSFPHGQNAGVINSTHWFHNIIRSAA